MENPHWLENLCWKFEHHLIICQDSQFFYSFRVTAVNFQTFWKDEKIAEIVTQLGLANAEKDELHKSGLEKDKIIKDLSEKISAMQNRLKSAETRADEAEKQKDDLETESGELRERAATLDSELNKVLNPCAQSDANVHHLQFLIYRSSWHKQIMGLLKGTLDSGISLWMIF